MNFTIVKKRVTPWVQVVVALAIGWLGMIIAHFLHISSDAEYFVAFLAITFFCLINTIVSITYESFFRYTVPSYYLYILLVAVLLLSARYLSGISIWTLWEYRMILISVTIFYIVISGLARVLRMIYAMATQEDS